MKYKIIIERSWDLSENVEYTTNIEGNLLYSYAEDMCSMLIARSFKLEGGGQVHAYWRAVSGDEIVASGRIECKRVIHGSDK